MKIKELQKTVNIAWSPRQQYPIYLAAGSAAQQIDSSTNATLEIYATNFSDPSFDLELKASQPSPYRFQKLIWSPTGQEGAHPNGLLVGGCESGHVMIYSAAKLLAQEDALIARQDKHTGPVSGLDFNPFQTNLLASSAAESEIFIWDLNNTTTHMNPGTKTQPLEDVQNVAWNRQVQHILASVFSTRCVIWDLRKSEQIIKLSDTQSRVRWHAIQWHPEVATQLWLASEDDQAPVVQLWDLRYATAPAKTLQIHQRGVLGMSWCPTDSDLMVSCGKDNRIYCWNPNTELAEGEILSEVASAASWYSNVQWCPRNPALIAASSLEGNVSIYSLFGGTQQQVQTANKIADSFPGMEQLTPAPISQQATQVVYHDLTRAPKMLRRPCGVAFGFGGKLLSFNEKSKSVQVSQVVTEPELVERANALEGILTDANYVEYCRKRADEMGDQHGRYLWYFIKANFDHNPREELLNLLGFNHDDVNGKFGKYASKKTDDKENENVEHLTQRLTQLTHSDSSEVDDVSTDVSASANVVDNNTVFDAISQQQQELSAAEKFAASPFKIPSGDHADSLITEALLTGNLEAAVELCLEGQRIPEALIIASTAGIEFLTRIQKKYLKEQQKQNNDLSHVIGALVTRDWLDFVSRCTIESWKEALVAALKHGERKVVLICERLGDRLLKERATDLSYVRNSMLCYVCAGSIDKLVAAWYHLKQVEQQNDNYKLHSVELQELAELVLVMSKALEQQGIAIELGEDNKLYAEFIADYGQLLASQGALQAAHAYIYSLTQGSTLPHAALEDLHERIFCAVTQHPKHKVNNQAQQQQQPQQQQQQQKPRGSFSHATPNWNAAPTIPTMPIPGVAAPLMNNFNNQQPFVPPAVPPAVAPTIPTAKPPQAYGNEVITQQPPRPLSTASSQGGGSGGGLLSSRSKYVVDPSVAAANSAVGGYGNIYNPPPASIPGPLPTMTPTNIFQPSMPATATPAPTAFNTPFNLNQQQQQQQPTNIMQPNPYNSSVYGGGNQSYVPGAPAQETNTQPPQNIQRNPTPPPGWNDPPSLKASRAYFYEQTREMSAEHAGTRKWKKIINHEPDILLNYMNVVSAPNTNQEQDYFLFQPKKVNPAPNSAAITHPLFGVDPNQNHNGYMDPNVQYQQPPPPMANANAAPISGYLNPALNNNPPPAAPSMLYGQQQQQPQQQQQQQQQSQGFPKQMNFNTSAISQPQQWNTTPGNMAYTDPNLINQQQQQQQQQYQQTQQQQHRKPDIPKEKPPLPEEYLYLQTVLEELKNRCLAATNDPRTKRKFIDVNKRLDNLYDCLRDGRLTETTIGALNQIVQYIQIGDYANAQQMQTQIAFGSDFSQCAGFMPGLKVLIQSALELHVVLR